MSSTQKKKLKEDMDRKEAISDIKLLIQLIITTLSIVCVAFTFALNKGYNLKDIFWNFILLSGLVFVWSLILCFVRIKRSRFPFKLYLFMVMLTILTILTTLNSFIMMIYSPFSFKIPTAHLFFLEIFVVMIIISIFVFMNKIIHKFTK